MTLLEPALVAARFTQYLAAMVLMGTPLFLLRALPAPVTIPSWPRPVIAGAGLVLLLSAVAGLLLQTLVLAGAIGPAALSSVAFDFDLGRAALARGAAGLAAFVLAAVLPRNRNLWRVSLALGALAVACLAWMGHAAATEGLVGNAHRISDVLHVLAAAGWMGALAGFCILLAARPNTPEQAAVLHRALQGFAGFGSVMVAVLLATGLINSWVLVGADHVATLLTTPYGQLLALKVALFAAMLVLAASNRYRLTPALGAATASPAAATGHLKRSLLIETALGVAVVAIVAWLGTLEPPAAL